MSGKIASFVSGGLLVIRIGKVQFAYCQSLSFNQAATVVPVGGIGSFSSSALEPVALMNSGSLRVVRWDNRLMKKIKEQALLSGNNNPFPSNMKGGVENELASTHGNSLLDSKGFNPIELLLSSTFDIDVFERSPNITKEMIGGVETDRVLASLGAISATQKPMFKFIDCRLTDYSFDFSPGQLLFENLNYVCAQIQENFEA